MTYIAQKSVYESEEKAEFNPFFNEVIQLKAVNMLNNIIDEEQIHSVYQPIVSLQNGAIFGYEALSRITSQSCTLNIEKLFELANKAQKTWELEKLCRTQALRGALEKPARTKLFINVDPNVVYDPNFISGFTQDKLVKLGLNSDDIIFEITEKSSVTSLGGFKEALDNYQSQGFKVAIDDFGAGYSGLTRMYSISPDYLKIDMSIVRDVNKDSRKRSVVIGIVKLCREVGIEIIAEGIETKEELATLIELDVDYGQGYFLARPNEKFQTLPGEIEVMIRHLRQINQSPSALLPGIETVGVICRRKETVYPDDKALMVYEQMKWDPSLTEICVTDREGNIHGILTRNHVLARFGGQYGYGLNFRRSVGEILDEEYMTVDSSATVDEIATLAMGRNVGNVYDAIIVTEQGKYLGVVTVKDLLLAAINIRERKASDSSPLTGLPGNNIIQRTIEVVIKQTEPYAIIYLDLDNFKAYNDAYGFSSGDTMLKTLAQAMTQSCANNDFMGHIGGDDFVIITRFRDLESVQKLCDDIVDAFAEMIQPLYSESDWERGYIISKDRNGFTEKFPVATLSVAAVTNYHNSFTESKELSKVIAEVKKKCKKQKGNAVVII